MKKLLGKTLKEMNYDFCNYLVDHQIPENQDLEYKHGNYLTNPCTLDKDKLDLIKKICGFANASGGFLIYGIKEQDHIPILITGTSNTNFEDIVIGQIVRGVHPNCDYDIWKIENPIDSTKPLYILEIFESPVPVMMYIKDKCGNFIIRRNESNPIATIIEVNQLFNKTENNRRLYNSARKIYKYINQYIEFLRTNLDSINDVNIVRVLKLIWMFTDECRDLEINISLRNPDRPKLLLLMGKYQITAEQIQKFYPSPPRDSLLDSVLIDEFLTELKEYWKHNFNIFL